MGKDRTKLIKIVHPNSKIKLQKRTNLPQDRLSELPDEILVCILSSLSNLKERQRTSVLSKRWRYLFRNLVFNNSILVTLQKKYDFGEITKDRYIMTVSSERSKFISRVNRALLKLNPDDIIDQFKVEFCLNATYTSVIDNWISHSLRKKVKKLSLHLGAVGGTKYTLTTQLLQSYSLKSLTDLSLASVDVTGEVLEYVLSNCPFIESLHVQYTWSLKNLKTSAPLPKLKHLEILYCNYFQQIEIHAINLVSFKYLVKMTILKAVLGDVPNFVSLSVLGGYARYLFDSDCSISRSLSQLETLDISFISGIRFKRIPELRNLRQLKLGIYHFTNGFFNCTSFLKASPMLHTFGLKFEIDVETKKAQGDTYTQDTWDTYTHQCLKVVELIDFVGCFAEMQLALYVINKATSLERIIIHTKKLSLRRIFSECAQKNLTATAINNAKELGTRLAPGVELVIL
ncbi:putative F-box/LRR-repeat protein At5g54820 [Quercus suber]|uniref:putative F-box/LRR-repeat protein At5g54820 n=1 Tax=Quercus suber TaxID=58331 RepID=UPI000CE17CD4|nr:putative F-box/LRR-repeat protein At5g54820 [Quercus suber]